MWEYMFPLFCSVARLPVCSTVAATHIPICSAIGINKEHDVLLSMGILIERSL